jgi:Rrf2 family protein
MKLTRAASYALHAVLYIAQHKPSVPLASHEIAQAYQIPERFLLKVLKPLVASGVLMSAKGPRGGYRLAKPLAKITMLEVVEAVDGPIRGQMAFQGQGGDESLEERLATICSRSADQMRKYLSSVKLPTLAGQMARMA